MFDINSYSNNYMKNHKHEKRYKKIKQKYENKKETKIIRKRNHKTYRMRLREKMFELLGKKCSNPHCLIIGMCVDMRCLQIDHVNGNGSKEQKKMGLHGMYRYYVNHPDLAKQKLQVLCANCNWIKRFERNEVRK